MITAIHVVQEITGAKQINALGFCVGGTLIANALAVMYARGEQPITSLTMLTALLDFEDAGVLDVFIDEPQVRLREQQLASGGIMPGLELGNTFSSLRPNDLVWNYVVSNYLEGKSPPAFDLLYWNGDSTNLPGPMYAWYLRNMYLENNLRVPGKLRCCGQSIDLGRIKVPTFVFAAREDHIVPWKAAYASARTAAGWRQGGRRALRAWRQRAHRRHDQSAVEEQAQLLGRRRRHAAGQLGCLVQQRGGASGQLVAGLEPLAGAVFGAAQAGAEAVRQRQVQADRAGARDLRQGKGIERL